MKKVHYSWYIILVGGLLMFGMSAQQMSQSVFMPQVADSLNIGMGTVSLAFSISHLLVIVLPSVVAILYQKYPMRIMACIAAAAQGLSLILMSVANHLSLVVIACALEAYAISSFMGVLSSTIIKRWFKDRGQFAYNLILFLSMMGGVVFTPIAGVLIEILDWRIAYRALAVFVFVIEIPVTLLFMKEYPAQLGLKPYEDPNAAENNVIQNRPTMNADVTVRGSWRSAAFYFMCLYAVALGFSSTLQNHVVRHLENLGYSSSFGAMVVSAGMAGGLIGRVILGFASEKFGLKAASAVYCMIGAAATAALCFAGNMGPAVVVVMGFLFGLVVRVSTVLASMMKYRIFGASDDYAGIVANTFIVTGILNAPSSVIFGYLYDINGTYTGSFIFVAVMFAVSIMLAGILLKDEKRVNPKV